MQVGSEGAHFNIIFQCARQQICALGGDEGTPKIKRLGAEQGKRPSCFEYPGGQLIEVVALQGCGPTGPLISRLHGFSIA